MAKGEKSPRSKRQVKEGVLRPEGQPSGKPPTSRAGGGDQASGSGEGKSQQGK